MSRLIPLGLLLLAAGCATYQKPAAEKERVYLTDASKYTWTGHTLDEVVKVFGRPSERTPDGTGATVLSYDEIQAIGDQPTQSGVHATATDDPADRGYDGAPSARPPADRTVKTKTQAQFWIDGEGKVTRFWFSPEMYRKGIPSPPSGSAGG